MIKLLLIAIVLFLILGGIIFLFFRGSNPSNKPVIPSALTSKSQSNTPISVRPSPKASLVQLYKPKESSPSGYIRLTELSGKTLIQLKSDDISNKIAFVYSGKCSTKGELVYPLVSLKDGKSQTIWEINFEGIKKELPLSIKVFQDAHKLLTYSSCADLKI